MIVIKNLVLARPFRRLIEAADLQLHPGWKIGLCGSNGSGKSSLLAALRGELAVEAGVLEWPRQWVVAHVAQDTPALTQSALEFVLDGDLEWRALEAKLERLQEGAQGAQDTEDAEDPSSDTGSQALADVHARLQTIGGYGARARGSALLHGLGFADAQFDWPVARFSGGWRMRLNVARALMCRSDLLLLDEPTNHLDLEAVLWLERWLKEYRGTLLLISHDRDFLDAVVGHIAHIEAKRLTLYTGGYTDFERQRAARLADQQSRREAQQRVRAHLQNYIDRFRAKATKARQAQSRLKALSRMPEIAAAHIDAPIKFAFFPPGAAPDPLLTLENAAIGYGGQTVLQAVDLSVRPGERLGLLGANGAGKSSLIQALAGSLPLIEGTRCEGRGLKIGYFAQQAQDVLRPEDTALQHLMRQAPGHREQALRDYLGGFDFSGERMDTPVGVFSGGERSRLVLALVTWHKPNLLLLDEPTNHLDLEMREALTRALIDFEGAVVVISHDRHLLRTTVDEFWCVQNQRVSRFDGDLEDYHAQRDKAGASVPDATRAPSSEPRERNIQARQARQDRLAKRREITAAITRVERTLAALEAEKTALDATLCAPDLYTRESPAAVAELMLRHARIQSDLASAEEAWLTCQEALEQHPL